MATRCAAEAALTIFEQLGDRRAKADTYRVIGMVFRDTRSHRAR
jgi:hypothetical protein